MVGTILGIKYLTKYLERKKVATEGRLNTEMAMDAINTENALDGVLKDEESAEVAEAEEEKAEDKE